MRVFLILAMFFCGMAFAEEKKEIVLTEDNTLVLNQAFTGKSVSGLIGKAKKMDSNLDSGYPIYLFLNTPGGSVQAGLELIEYLEGLNRPVHTVTLFAASMGWQLLQHLGDRYVLRYGVLMSHKASGGFMGEFGGTSSQLDSRYSLWLRRLNIMDRQTVKRTEGKKTLQQYQSEYDNELWLNGAEAVKNGYADEVVSVKCDKGLSGVETTVIKFMGLNVELDFDKCPIRTHPESVRISMRTSQGYMDLDKFLAEGGKFGKDCSTESVPPTKDWNGEVIPGKTPDLCLMDRDLTLEKVFDIAKKQEAKITNRNKKVIKMSFGNFVSEL